VEKIYRVIMSPTELKMQPTIHLQSKPGYCPYPALLWKCIVGCIVNSVTREIPCMIFCLEKKVNRKNTGCPKIIVFRVRGLVGDILLTK
jgi:hypothetical protein